MNAVAVQRLRRRWGRAAGTRVAVDLCDGLMRLTVDVLTAFVLGTDFNTLATGGPPIHEDFRGTVEGMLQTFRAALEDHRERTNAR